MSFDQNFMCSSFKKELLFGVHDFDLANGDTFKLALYTNSAVPTDFGGTGSVMNASVETYNATNEISGTGYTATGAALTNIDPSLPASPGTTAITDFEDLTFSTATITARGAVIYNTTPNTTSLSVTNPAVVVLDFGADKTSTAGDFTIVFPTADASNAIIRIA
jgi:hypothetical protein